VIHDGEMNCLEDAGRQKGDVNRRCTISTTLSPCPLCSGAILLYRIPRVAIGENVTFQGAESLLQATGMRVDVGNDRDCVEIMRHFIAKNPGWWDEGVGV
jgi:cytosine deaminase